MIVTPIAFTILILFVLGIGWLTIRERVSKLDPNLMFHLGAVQRDLRRAKFYHRTIWIGLASDAVSVLVLNFIATLPSHTGQAYNIILGLSYGLGLWGVFIIGMVWMQIGKRTLDIDRPKDDYKLQKVREKNDSEECR